MKLTAAEQSFITAHREQIELDSRDWERGAWITDTQLATMSAVTCNRIITQAHWIHCPVEFIWRNTRHPDNAQWLELRKATELLLKSEVGN